MPSPSVLITQVATAVFVNVLKPCGFRKRAAYLSRACGNVIHCVHFQTSSWGTPSNKSFTLNLGVIDPELWTIWTGKRASTPERVMFPVCQRVGLLTKERHDHWWGVDDRADFDQITIEVETMITTFALPFFELFADRAAILEQFRSGNSRWGPIPNRPLLEAVLESQTGDASRATHLFGELLEQPGVHDRSFARALAQRAGIELE